MFGLFKREDKEIKGTFTFGCFELINPTIEEVEELKNDFDMMFLDLESDYMSSDDMVELQTIRRIQKKIENFLLRF